MDQEKRRRGGGGGAPLYPAGTALPLYFEINCLVSSRGVESPYVYVCIDIYVCICWAYIFERYMYMLPCVCMCISGNMCVYILGEHIYVCI